MDHRHFPFVGTKCASCGTLRAPPLGGRHFFGISLLRFGYPRLAGSSVAVDGGIDPNTLQNVARFGNYFYTRLHQVISLTFRAR